MTYSALPKWTITDANGDPIVAGTLYFYEEGTTTPKNVYSDSARSVSAGAELTTDSYGQVGPVYLDTAAPTKVVAKDAADATLWTIDSLTPPSGATGVAGGGGVARSASPLDYGAVGDGAADETSEVQSALNAATGEVDLAGKTYRCDSALTWPEGIRITNGTLDFSLATATNLLSCQGSVGSSIALTADAAIGDNFIDITDTTGFAAGDWVIIGSTADWVSPNKDGESIRVKTVTSGTRLTFESKVADAYLTSQGAFVRKITTVKRGVLEDVRIIAAYVGTQYAVYVPYSDGFEFRNVTIEGVYSAGIRLFRAVNAKVRGCTFRDIVNGPGVLVESASSAISIDESEFNDCSVGVRLGNAEDHVVRHSAVSNCTFHGCRSVNIALGQNSQFCSAVENRIFGSTSGSDTGITDIGSDNRIDSNVITDTTSFGISIGPARTKSVAIGADTFGPMGAQCVGNIIRSTATGIRLSVTGTSSAVMAGIRIDRNIVMNATTGVDVDCSRVLDALSVSYNEFDYIAGDAIDIAHTGNSNRLRVAGNVIRDCSSGSGIIINADGSFVGCDIADNEVNEFGTYGIHVNVATTKTGTRLRLLRNTCVTTQASSEAVLIEPTDAGSLTDVTVEGNYIEADTPVRILCIYDPSGVRIVRNTVKGTGTLATGTDDGAIYCSTKDTTAATLGKLLIADNDVEGGDAGIIVRALADNDIAGVRITGNRCACDIWGILAAAATGVGLRDVSINSNAVDVESGGTGIIVSSVDADEAIRVAVSGNLVDAVNDGIELVNCKNLSVAGNAVALSGSAVPTVGIDVDTPTNAVVSGNSVSSADTTDSGSSCIEVAGSVCTNVLVSGNQCEGGYNSILESVTTPAKLMADSNLMTGYGAGGNLVGTWTLGVASSTNTDYKNGF